MLNYEKYKDFTDEQLINIINSGDKEALDFLLDKYKNLVRKNARALFLIGGDNDDLIQEGMIGLYKAIRDFNLNRENTFFGFANLCISRQIYSAIKASRRKKHAPLNTYISLYSPAFSDYDKEVSLVDVIYSNTEQNPEEMLIDKENVNSIELELGKKLSELEKKVLDLYLKGIGYTQIAEILKKEPKSIDNALQRIKSKLNFVLKALWFMQI